MSDRKIIAKNTANSLNSWHARTVDSFITVLCFVVIALLVPKVSAAATAVPVGYNGLAYAVPAQGLASVSGTILKPYGVVVPAEIPAGQPFPTESLAPNYPAMVAVYTPEGRIRTARTNMWRIPDSVELQRLKINVNGVETLLGDTNIRYLNANAARFDDPATPHYDGIDGGVRSFLNCTTTFWSLEAQKFAADLLIQGIHKRRPDIIEKGIAAMDWGVSTQQTNGRFLLSRNCPTIPGPIEDYSGEHGASQFVEAISRSAWALAGSQYAGQYRTTIDKYVKATVLGADYLSQPTPWNNWFNRWMPGFTHKRYIMSSLMVSAAAMSTDYNQAVKLAYIGDVITGNGIKQQWLSADPLINGVNPEREGYDVFYHGWGLRLAGSTYSLLAPTSTRAVSLAAMQERAIDWKNTRTDPVTGAVDMTGSTRTCKEKGSNGVVKGYDVYPTAEALLYWGMKFNRPELIDRAQLMSNAFRARLDACPVAS